MLSNIFLNRVSVFGRVSLELRFGVRLLSINDNLALSFFLHSNPFGLGCQRDQPLQSQQLQTKHNTPFNDGPLGSRNDEERGKMRKCSMNCRI